MHDDKPRGSATNGSLPKISWRAKLARANWMMNLGRRAVAGAGRLFRLLGGRQQT